MTGMADLEDMLKRLEKDKTMLYFGGLKRIAEDVEEAAELLKQYSGLTKALEQINAVNEHLNAEIGRLRSENNELYQKYLEAIPDDPC